MNFKNILFIAFCLISSSLYAQTEQHFRLLDIDGSTPVVEAYFEYGNQKGNSDTNGQISFNHIANGIMKVSHVNYGSWEWNEEELNEIVKNQVSYRRSIVVNLYPVTVIALRQQDEQPEDQVSIDYQDRMEHDGAAILNQIPAFNSIRKGGNYGFDPVFRGYKYDQLNVVLNGSQCASSACPNRMDPSTSQMAPNMMDRIEILKGPHALRFGTGFGATVNFIPSKLRFTSEKDLYGRFSTGYESNGNIARGEGQLGFSGEKFDLSVFGSWSQGDDYLTGNADTVQSDFERGSIGANLGLKISSNQQLRLMAMFNKANDSDFPALAMDLRNDETLMLNIRHDIQFNRDNLESWNTTVFGSFVDHLMDNLLKPLDPRMVNASTLAKTYNYGGRTEGIWQYGKGKLFAGLDYRVEGAEGIRTREFLMGPNMGKVVEDNAWQDGRINRTGVLAEYHLGTELFNYIISGRLELNDADVNDPADEFTTVQPDTKISQTNPSISLGVLKPLGKNIKTGLWIGRAQRSGSLTERFINYFPVGQDPYEMIGNPQIDPEVNNQLDLTFEWKNEKTAISIDLFASYLQDYISSVIDTSLSPRIPSSPGVRRFMNIDEAYKTGFEVMWIQELPLNLQHQLGIAYTHAEDLNTSEALPEIPPMDFRYTLQGSYLKGKLKPELTFRYALEQTRISSEFGETATPAFALLDVKIAYGITEKLSVNVGVNNAFDEYYYEHLNRSVKGTTNAIYAPGRNIFGNISFKF